MSGRDHVQYPERIPARELLAAIGATQAERMAVQRAVRATLAWEAWALARPRTVGGTGERWHGQTGEQVIDALGGTEQRRRMLMSAAIAATSEKRGRSLTGLRLEDERRRKGRAA